MDYKTWSGFEGGGAGGGGTPAAAAHLDSSFVDSVQAIITQVGWARSR